MPLFKAKMAALAALLLAIVGWLVYTQVWGTGGERPVAWTDLTPKLGAIEFTRRTTGVYHSRRAFLKFLDESVPGRPPKLPPLDWEHHQVVVIALGPRSSTGYSLRVLRVVEQRRGIYVYAREQTPSLGEPVVARVTYPYRLLRMKGSTKSVYVKLEGR
ncbi:MAG: protease complex subunit PrcB family protein [Gaiellaceae bacterium]